MRSPLKKAEPKTAESSSPDLQLSKKSKSYKVDDQAKTRPFVLKSKQKSGNLQKEEVKNNTIKKQHDRRSSILK